MTLKVRIHNLLLNNWGIAAIFLGLFFLTHGYRYAWDDQHLELPLLKALIDPELYPKDYYVASLKQNFTSFFYPILSKLITIDQIQPAYFILFIISRYFLFFWIYKFWLLVSKERSTAFVCTLTLLVLSKIPEFYYLTFSHQEFTLPIIFAGLYYFYKEKFVLAALLLGIAANFHAIYSLLVSSYMFAYLFFAFRKHGFRIFFKSLGVYILACLPFLIWTYQKSKLTYIPLDSPILNNWLDVFRTVAPEALTFHHNSLSDVTKHPMTFIVAAQEYIYYLIFYVFNCVFNADFRKEFKNHALVLVAFSLLYIYFLAGYVTPNKFILSMNFYRNTQFLHFLLIGYSAILMMRSVRVERPWVCLAIGIVYPMTATRDVVAICSTIVLSLVLFLNLTLKKINQLWRYIIIFLIVACLALFISFIVHVLGRLQINPFTNWVFYTKNIILAALFLIIQFTPWKKAQTLRPMFVVLTLILFTVWYAQFHYNQWTKPQSGFDRLQSDWEDMQRYVQAHTPKDALLLVPYDMEMGGFRIQSERSIVVCYRDAGIIGFDYKAIGEWKNRIADVEEFKVRSVESSSSAINNAIHKYHANYIIFTTKTAPAPHRYIDLVYNNNYFALYKINSPK